MTHFQIAPFERLPFFPRYGSNTLLVIPTDDKKKSRFIEEWAAEYMHQEPGTYITVVPVTVVPVNPEVKKEKDKDLRHTNAYNYIRTALNSLDGNIIFKEQKIGTIFAVSVDSFIQTNPAPSAKTELLVQYVANHHVARSYSTKRITIPAEYLGDVRSSGSVDDNPDHGKATVGQEQIVPAEPAPELPPFPSYQFPQCGDAVLVVICHSKLLEWPAPRAGCSECRTSGEGQRVDTVDTAAVDSPQPDPYGTARARTSEIQTSDQSKSSPTDAERLYRTLSGATSLYRLRPLYDGDGIIRTGNRDHTRIIEEWAAEQVPEPLEIHVSNIMIDTEVGAQPYNNAGQDGAHSRIRNALGSLDGSDIFQARKIGTVIAVSVENFIRTETGRPADFGLVVWHNATTGTTGTCCTEGVTVRPEHIEHARSFGSVGDNPDHGKVTVGSSIANMEPEIDKAHRQMLKARMLRYKLFRKAIGGMPNPFSTKG